MKPQFDSVLAYWKPRFIALGGRPALVFTHCWPAQRSRRVSTATPASGETGPMLPVTALPGLNWLSSPPRTGCRRLVKSCAFLARALAEYFQGVEVGDQQQRHINGRDDVAKTEVSGVMNERGPQDHGQKQVGRADNVGDPHRKQQWLFRSWSAAAR